LQGYEVSDGFQGKIMMIESDGSAPLSFLTPPTPTPDYEFNLPQWSFDGTLIYADSDSSYDPDEGYDNSTYTLWALDLSGEQTSLYTHARGPGTSFNPIRSITPDGPMLVWKHEGTRTFFDATADADPVLPYPGGAFAGSGGNTTFWATPHYLHVADIPTSGLIQGDAYYVGPPDEVSGNPIFGRYRSWEAATSTWHDWGLGFGPDNSYSDWHYSVRIVRDVSTSTEVDLVTATDIDSFMVSNTSDSTFTYAEMNPIALSRDGATLVFQANNLPYRLFAANPRTHGTPHEEYYMACDATDGSHLRILFGGTTEHLSGTTVVPDYQDQVVPFYCFSPDDSLILYVKTDSATGGGMGVGTISPDGSGKVDRFDASGLYSDIANVQARWTPDGSQIVVFKDLGLVSQVFDDCPAPCHITIGSGRASIGI